MQDEGHGTRRWHGQAHDGVCVDRPDDTTHVGVYRGPLLRDSVNERSCLVWRSEGGRVAVQAFVAQFLGVLAQVLQWQRSLSSASRSPTSISFQRTFVCHQ